MNVELRHLRAFVTVARTLNFTRAATELHIAQPSLSYTIRQLEGQLGFALFDRTTRSTVLTADGLMFLDEARAVLDRFEASMQRASRVAAGELGRLRVGYLIGAAVDFVPLILRAFTARYPEVLLELTEYDFGAPNGGLDTGASDVAIVRPPLAGVAGVVQTVLLHERRFVCMPAQHRLAHGGPVAVADVLAEPIVAAPGSNAWRDYWLLTDLRDRPATVAYEAATFEAELQAVAFGRGISIVPEIAPRIYSRPGVVFAAIDGVPDCEVVVARPATGPRAARNFARIARKVTRGEL